jgi:acetyltransferase-like isoleucine patch superfamily enzyme
MRCVILGMGGHARAIRNWLVPPDALMVRMTTDDDDVRPEETVFIGLGDVAKRQRLYGRYHGMMLNDGRQIMRAVTIDPSAIVGDNVLVNTGAQIDHDCVIRFNSIIGPGAILCGGVSLGAACEIGAGAIILQKVAMPTGTRVPAGTLVVSADDWRRPQKMQGKEEQ